MQTLEELPVDQSFAPALREGLIHHGRGRLPEAALCYQRAYEQNSGDADALVLLGIVARQVKHVTAAVAFSKLAVEQRPVSSAARGCERDQIFRDGHAAKCKRDQLRCGN